MNDSSEYITAYFEKQLGEAEVRQFEQRIEQDDLFAREVALYITTKEAVKQALADNKKEQWRALGTERKTDIVPAPVKTLSLRRWLPYAAAACLIFFISHYYFSDQRSLNDQVAGYIQEETAVLSPQMGTSGDSLELGIKTYNLKEYTSAKHIFTTYLLSHKTEQEAILYAGCAYLRLKDHDSALVYFQELSRLQLYSNKGPYYTALTLLERNKKGDKEKAKQALQTVLSDEHNDGRKEAQKLLDMMK